MSECRAAAHMLAGIDGRAARGPIQFFHQQEQEKRKMKTTGKDTAAKLAATQQQAAKQSADAAQRNTQRILEGRTSGPTKRK